MPFKYKPISEEEEGDLRLLKDGEYDAVVKSAVEEVSKKGNNCVKLLLEVYDGRDETGIFDYLVDIDSMAWKTRHFCESAGLDYKAGAIDTRALPGTNLRVIVGRQKAQNGYPAKNTVVDYVARTSAGVVTGATQESFVATDDDVPFSVFLVPVIGALIGGLLV